jgi:transcriptional regulator with XRE-family HTH domain
MNGLKRILDRLGLKQTEFAKLLDVSPRTVTLWVTGESPVPGPVKAYLRLLLGAGASVRAAEFSRLLTHRPGFDDGLYSLTYAGANAGQFPSSGIPAVALLRSGRIVGTDAGGGKFEGTYHFDSVRQTNHFHVWLRVPPAGELVTGADVGQSGGVIEVIAELERAEPVASTVAYAGGLPLELTLAYLGPLSS